MVQRRRSLLERERPGLSIFNGELDPPEAFRNGDRTSDRRRNILFEERPFATLQPGGVSAARITGAERRGRELKEPKKRKRRTKKKTGSNNQ